MPRQYLDEFVPIDGRVDYGYVQELLAASIMPSVVVRVGCDDGMYYAVTNPQGRISGLPIIDLGALEEDEEAAHYVSYRLRKVFGLDLPQKDIEILSFESNESPYLKSINNKNFPHIHNRIYLPATVAYTNSKPDRVNNSGSSKLITASAKNILNSIVAPDAGDALYQLLDVHRAVFNHQLWK